METKVGTNACHLYSTTLTESKRAEYLRMLKFWFPRQFRTPGVKEELKKARNPLVG